MLCDLALSTTKSNPIPSGKSCRSGSCKQNVLSVFSFAAIILFISSFFSLKYVTVNFRISEAISQTKWREKLSSLQFMASFSANKTYWTNKISIREMIWLGKEGDTMLTVRRECQYHSVYVLPYQPKTCWLVNSHLEPLSDRYQMTFLESNSYFEIFSLPEVIARMPVFRSCQVNSWTLGLNALEIASHKISLPCIPINSQGQRLLVSCIKMEATQNKYANEIWTLTKNLAENN